jgi:hypothetical protein
MDDLKILKVEYLINHLLDQTQILNLSLDDQTMGSQEDRLLLTGRSHILLIPDYVIYEEY